MAHPFASYRYHWVLVVGGCPIGGVIPSVARDLCIFWPSAGPLSCHNAAMLFVIPSAARNLLLSNESTLWNQELESSPSEPTANDQQPTTNASHAPPLDRRRILL